MPDNHNKIIEQRLKNIKGRLSRLSFLLALLKKFKEDRALIDNPSRVFDGSFLFYYYSFSQFILEIYKLFDDDNDEYYTLPKLLNHIESNIRYVGWYKSETTYPEPTNKQWKSGKVIWSSGETKEWQEPAKGKELEQRKKLITDLKLKFEQNRDDLEKVKLARDKVIAHLDKDFQEHNIRIELETFEKLFMLSYEIFNILFQKIKGTTLHLEHIEPDTLSSLLPITKFYQLRSRLITTNITRETTIPTEELNKIIFSNSIN